MQYFHCSAVFTGKILSVSDYVLNLSVTCVCVDKVVSQ